MVFLQLSEGTGVTEWGLLLIASFLWLLRIEVGHTSRSRSFSIQALSLRFFVIFSQCAPLMMNPLQQMNFFT